MNRPSSSRRVVPVVLASVVGLALAPKCNSEQAPKAVTTTSHKVNAPKHSPEVHKIQQKVMVGCQGVIEPGFLSGESQEEKNAEYPLDALRNCLEDDPIVHCFEDRINGLTCFREDADPPVVVQITADYWDNERDLYHLGYPFLGADDEARGMIDAVRDPSDFEIGVENSHQDIGVLCEGTKNLLGSAVGDEESYFHARAIEQFKRELSIVDEMQGDLNALNVDLRGALGSRLFVDTSSYGIPGFTGGTLGPNFVDERGKMVLGGVDNFRDLDDDILGDYASHKIVFEVPWNLEHPYGPLYFEGPDTENVLNQAATWYLENEGTD